jgi:drug/metabolite transporter (DMT)-like permease
VNARPLAAADGAAGGLHRFKTWHLFAVAVAIWGTTWHAITYQLGPVAPEVGVALRFALAGALVLAVCAWRGMPWRVARASHARLALQGALLYGVSYVCVYHAERWVASGLVAVGYSASPLIVGLGAHWAFGAPLTRRFLYGAAFSVLGVGLIFWPELSAAAGSRSTLRGAAFTAAAVLLSACGTLSASRNSARGLAFWPALGWGMCYGAITTGAIAVAMGHSFALPAALSWWLSLVYLSLAGSALAFACFLSLQERVGPGRAGTVGVMTPLIALLVSLALEGYAPGWITLAGVLLALLGNWFILRQAAAPKIADPSPPKESPP